MSTLVYSARTACKALAAVICTVLLCPATLADEEIDELSTQIWGNFIQALPKSESLYLEYDIEGASAVSTDEPWSYLYGTGLVEYYPNGFFDLTGELVTGATRQSSEEDSFEAALRFGVRLHLVNQIFNSPVFKKVRSERISGRRFNIANLTRIEFRRLWYNGDRPTDNDTRFRNRLEFKLALNRPRLSDDNLWYLLADNEWFYSVEDNNLAERFATKRRLRIGLGYRRNYSWRTELLLMKDDARDTINDEIEVEAYMLNLRIKKFY